MQFVLVFRRYAPFAKFGFGFEGDHRAWPSISMKATARTIAMVPFSRNTVGTVVATSSGTQYLGGGDWVRQLGGHHTSKVLSTLKNMSIGAYSVGFTASTAGANPMIPGAPTIDTFVDFRAEWMGSGLRFQGTIRGDDFPNAEIFVLDSKDVGCLLFDGRTTGGQDTGPITRLAGLHEGQKLGSFYCAMPLSLSGSFLAPKGSCPTTTMQSAKR
jgi:hypothetical protein